MVKSVIILGSTGSIGENALRVIADHPDLFRVAGLAARRSGKRLLEQARQFGVRRVALADETAAAALPREPGLTVLTGDSGVAELASGETDIVLCALVGLSGLRPVMAALEAGHDVALATKEVLVAAGEHVMGYAARHNRRILPVDSEHSAIFQCLQACRAPASCVLGSSCSAAGAEGLVERIWLTASGGPFATAPADLSAVTPAEALAHPRWHMGRKVTIDSATMMNKGFELLEARWLFNIPLDRITVAIHPQSVVHSMVTFRDGSTLAQLAPPDMRLAIQYALTYPDRPASPALPRLTFDLLRELDFREPDPARFPCLGLVRQAAAMGGTAPAVANAADEIAVEAFLSGRMRFTDIPRLIESALEARAPAPCDSLDSVFAADAWARAFCAGRIGA